MMGAGGSIQELGKGVYRIWADAGKDEAGKRVRFSERVRGNKRAAQRRLNQLKAEIQSGEHVPPNKETFGAFIDRWWPSKKATLSPVNAYNSQIWLDRYILLKLGDRPIQRITSAEISELLSDVSSGGKLSVAEHLFRFLRTVFRRAVEMGEIARSP